MAHPACAAAMSPPATTSHTTHSSSSLAAGIDGCLGCVLPLVGRRFACSCASPQHLRDGRLATDRQVCLEIGVFVAADVEDHVARVFRRVEVGENIRGRSMRRVHPCPFFHVQASYISCRRGRGTSGVGGARLSSSLAACNTCAAMSTTSHATNRVESVAAHVQVKGVEKIAQPRCEQRGTNDGGRNGDRPVNAEGSVGSACWPL
eukprot:1669598-Pleurochrysis_carterae.AAC.1